MESKTFRVQIFWRRRKHRLFEAVDKADARRQAREWLKVDRLPPNTEVWEITSDGRWLVRKESEWIPRT